MSPIDFETLNKALLAKVDLYLSHWLSGGHTEGSEYIALNPTRQDKNKGSFRINRDNGKWCDFSTKDAGGDLISLYAYIKYLPKNCIEAAKELMRHMGSEDSHIIETKKKSLWMPIMPVPKDIGIRLDDHPQYGRRSAYWEYGKNLRFVAAWGKWFIWDGRYWKLEDTLHAFDMIRKTCRSFASERTRTLTDNMARRITSAHTVAAAEKFAKSDREIAATIDQWDTDPWLLNTPGGIVDICTGIISPNISENYMTKITSVAPEGECPIWLEFLQRVTNGDEDLIAFLRRIAGYCLTGITREHALFFFYGTGGNGKGVFINTLTRIMGDYASVANMDTFTASNNEKHPTDLAMLRGARFVAAQETEEGRRWSESRIKALTGGDPITARFMRQDHFTFIPQFKLVIVGNHKLALRNVDEAIRRRFHLIPFTIKIPESEKDLNLPEKLKAEDSGILKWMIQGAKEWSEHGLNPPKIVREATADYLAEEDALERWITERCVLDGSHKSTMTDLCENWKEWCATTGEDWGNFRRFTQNLRTKHLEFEDWQCPSSRRHGLKGIQAIKQMKSNYNGE